MRNYSTREAAKMLGITQAGLSIYINLKKIPPPQTFQIGKRIVHSWTEEQIEEVRKLLPKIANGRKTRHSKTDSAADSKQSAKPKTKKKPQPRSRSAG